MCCVTKQPSGVQPPIYLFFIEEAFLDACKDDAVGALHSPVGLGVIDRGEHEFGSDASAEFFERLRVELFAIVYREFLWYPKPANYVLPKEFAICFGCDAYQRLSFDPFGEVFNGHHSIFIISLGGR